ncbi:DUF3179 domain-containing protein [Palleronia abyssalis]|uniref:DUF3179 domain-containing protein n=1 Tax=Palleronia abyssalis TaxID=1501240 RepID=A0A2R8BQG1_9RHOB|nr:DUF3179 domain-containing protein [Palleronia abyssalis]SPJ22412.1 hypothetical protein PAA8504_00205 [Palleronia abyssalis]
MLYRLCLALVVAAGSALAQAAPPDAWRSEWSQTDFSNSAIGDWTEIISGGPPKDGIPAITSPDMIAVAQEARLSPREPVMAYAGRAYPIRYLMWHEIVNDHADGRPIAVTFCPLCNTGIVFDRSAADTVLEFGVTGKLRHSDMIMFDRQTESWWQQATGEAIVGALTGTELRPLPALMQSWQAFRDEHPDGVVMDAPDTARRYGTNPYAGYDSAPRPFLYSGEAPPHGIAPLARVVRVGDRAWPLTRLRDAGRVEEAGLTLNWAEGQASALDTGVLAEGREVGDIRVTDEAGEPVAFDIPFAFAFDAFHPDGTWMLGD